MQHSEACLSKTFLKHASILQNKLQSITDHRFTGTMPFFFSLKLNILHRLDLNMAIQNASAVSLSISHTHSVTNSKLWLLSCDLSCRVNLNEKRREKCDCTIVASAKHNMDEMGMKNSCSVQLLSWIVSPLYLVDLSESKQTKLTSQAQVIH